AVPAGSHARRGDRSGAPHRPPGGGARLHGRGDVRRPGGLPGLDDALDTLDRRHRGPLDRKREAGTGREDDPGVSRGGVHGERSEFRVSGFEQNIGALTRNQEPGTRNQEPGTRNQEPGTRNYVFLGYLASTTEEIPPRDENRPVTVMLLGPQA